jgi:hypothetical protein
MEGERERREMEGPQKRKKGDGRAAKEKEGDGRAAKEKEQRREKGEKKTAHTCDSKSKTFSFPFGRSSSSFSSLTQRHRDISMRLNRNGG